MGRSGPVWVQGWNRATTRTLARLGRLEALQWARANGCDWDWQTCSAAAKGRHAEVLRWARANGCATRPDEDEKTCCDMVACRTWCMYTLAFKPISVDGHTVYVLIIGNGLWVCTRNGLVLLCVVCCVVSCRAWRFTLSLVLSTCRSPVGPLLCPVSFYCGTSPNSPVCALPLPGLDRLLTLPLVPGLRDASPTCSKRGSATHPT